MKLHLSYWKFDIFLDNVPDYSFGSMDNRQVYSREYRLDNEPYKPSSLHDVRVISTDDETEVAACILGASDGATSIHENSAIINGDSLIMAVGPFIASLHLPNLELNWKTRTDDATCFGVYHSTKNRCYISHGELDVARISYAGAIEWTNSGADIFTNGFNVTDHQVEAIDWNEDIYVWDIHTGKPIKTKPNNLLHESAKKQRPVSKRLTAMDKKAFIIHIAICLIIGGIIAFFTNAKWFAASFWVSAALYINGSLAYYEDTLPGGFENPDGKETPEFAKGFGAFKFWFCSIVTSIVLAVIGFLIQKYAWWGW